ncbi:unnamed protein product [Closterium sp. NIES-65]|nr:unnamed protein product [Closterium sp. NIES-65]
MSRQLLHCTAPPVTPGYSPAPPVPSIEALQHDMALGCASLVLAPTNVLRSIGVLMHASLAALLSNPPPPPPPPVSPLFRYSASFPISPRLKQLIRIGPNSVVVGTWHGLKETLRQEESR